MEQYPVKEQVVRRPTEGERVVEATGEYKHVMAVTLDPRTGNTEGVVRCIASREGSVDTYGYVDRSELHRLHCDAGGRLVIGEKLSLSGERALVDTLAKKLGNEGEWEYLGNEDPDIWVDEETGLLHLYFTMPFQNAKEDRMSLSLGHAVGSSLDSLVMTEPVLFDTGEAAEDGLMGVAKEVSIAPKHSRGSRFNLVESADKREGIWYSVVRKAEAKDMSHDWEMQNVLFHPGDSGIAWAGEHASPGPLMPKSFLDMGEGKLVGFMNGREASDRSGKEVKYGKFSIGLFVYDYENGEIEWVSPEPFLFDSEATTITFASQFVEIGNGQGSLYAHVDDSFVRCYGVDRASIKSLLPTKYTRVEPVSSLP